MNLLEQDNQLLVNHLPLANSSATLSANPSSNTYIGKGTLLVNEFGNGFINLLHLFPSQPNQTNQPSQPITVYIPKSQLSRAFHLETVEIEYTHCPQSDTYYGRVVNYSLIGRKFVGLVHHIFKTDLYIYIPELKLANLVMIQTQIYLEKQTWVQIQITKDQPSMPLLGTLISIIPITLPANVNDIIALKYSLTNLEQHHPKQLELKPSYSEIDQTHLETFTIDPPGSLDCDDAFSIEFNSSNSNQARIYVHIANVAYYFNPNDTPPALWEQITTRATTFYGTNGTNWPMLPPEYANYICSILPTPYKNEPSHVLTCEFLFSRDDSTIEFIKWYPAIVVSKTKYDYDTVDNILAEQTHPIMNILLESATIIKQQSNDFIFGKETPAHWLVRYWMIYVNQVMCRDIYRYNPIPEAGKQEILARYISHLTGTNYNTIERSILVEFIRQYPDDLILQYLGKVSMVKSYYTTNPEENYHYGIGIAGYTHWTSPIRRLPDLLNHLQLLGYAIPSETLNQYLQNANNAEIKQDAIERFIITWNNATKYKVGDILEGVIINVFKTGVSVYVPELQNKYTIHISKLSSKRLEFDTLEYKLKSIDMDNNPGNHVVISLFQRLRLRISKMFFDVLEFDVLE